jgi:glutaredoxin
MTRIQRWIVGGAMVLVAFGPAGCRPKGGGGADVHAEPSEADSLVVKTDSTGLLLTWIDEKGDFHVETKVDDVPLVGRDAVRVLDPAKYDGTHTDKVLVADLRVAKPDGTFPVKEMSRADFEALALARRKDAGLTLAGVPAPSPDETPSAAGSAGQPQTRPAVIIYGAEWCGACHDAAAYLKRKGVAFIEKDVEKDQGASREMQQKLARAGLHGGSIPVLDVRGKVMVGFNPHAVDEALGRAL